MRRAKRYLVEGRRKRNKLLTIVGGVFLAGDHGLRMEQRPVWADLHIIDNARFEVYVDRTRDVFSCSGFGKESRKTVLSRFCGAFLDTAVGLRRISRNNERKHKGTHAQPMLEGVKFPFVS